MDRSLFDDVLGEGDGMPPVDLTRLLTRYADKQLGSMSGSDFWFGLFLGDDSHASLLLEYDPLYGEAYATRFGSKEQAKAKYDALEARYLQLLHAEK